MNIYLKNILIILTTYTFYKQNSLSHGIRSGSILYYKILPLWYKHTILYLSLQNRVQNMPNRRKRSSTKQSRTGNGRWKKTSPFKGICEQRQEAPAPARSRAVRSAVLRKLVDDSIWRANSRDTFSGVR
jgi:hypothetical protein